MWWSFLPQSPRNDKMWLIQTEEWWGPSRHAPPEDKAVPERRPVTFATRLEISDALRLIRDYEEKFKQCYKLTAVEFTVLGIQQVPDLDAEALHIARLRLVETMSNGLDEVLADRGPWWNQV